MTTANACHRYWDVELHPENYSYVDAALNAGYSILTYDRLGTGLSEKADAYTVVQFPVEVEILRGLTTLARSGNLVSASNLTSDSITPALRSYRPNKVVHVGHSLGSMTTMGLVSAYSDLTDGVILTGSFFDNETNIQFNTFGLEYAPANDPKNFADRSSGYLVQGTASAAQQLFLAKGSFEPEMLEYSAKIKQTICVGEMFSASAVVGSRRQHIRGQCR
jgi:pimeloyl-ACP methyl ester carboxylesterase